MLNRCAKLLKPLLAIAESTPDRASEPRMCPIRPTCVAWRIHKRQAFVDSRRAHTPQFHSVLTMDLAREANLNPSKVHVITSASKDFSINVRADRGS